MPKCFVYFYGFIVVISAGDLYAFFLTIEGLYLC